MARTSKIVLLAGLAACRRSPAPNVTPALASAPAPVVDAGVAASADAAAPRVPVGLACLADHLGGRIDGDALVVGEARFAWDDGKTKTTAERIAAPDLEDMFALGYPTGAIAAVDDPEADPGRVRHEGLFRAVYGADANAVSHALVRVPFAGHTVSFHRRAAPALARVDAKLRPLIATHARFFRDLGGTFSARTIAGTDRTSAHAWGIAIDLDPSASDYWRNAPAGHRAWKNQVPAAVVDAFESEGFVWGGRWFHYDTMHFEYRPELLDARCRTSPQDR
jgi:hypothetical protein